MEEVEVIVEPGPRLPVQGTDNHYRYLKEKESGKVVVTFKAPRWLVEALDRCAARNGKVHRSEAIREAIMLYLKAEGCLP